MILVEKKLNLSFYLLSTPHLTPETSMSKLIWVNPPVGHLSIGLHFWHPCHLLASALTLSRVQNRQVSYSIFMSSATVLFSHKAEKTENDIYWCEMLCFMVIVLNVGASSTISKVWASEGNTNSTIEVGQGSLKLLYSADDGKLTHYLNSRSLVSFC